MASKSDYIIRLTELSQQLNTGNWEIPAEVDLSSDRAVSWFSQTLPSIGFGGYTEPSFFESAKHGGTAAINALEQAIDWSTGDIRVDLTPEDISKAGSVIAANDTQSWFRLSLLTDLIDATIAFISNSNTSFAEHFEMAVERREARENYIDLKKEGLSEAEAVLLTGVRYEGGKAVHSHAPLYLSAQERAKYNDYLGNNELLNTQPAERVLEGHDIVSGGVALGLVGLASRLPVIKPILNTTAATAARGTVSLAERIGSTVQAAHQASSGAQTAANSAQTGQRVSTVLGPNGSNVVVNTATQAQSSAAIRTLQLNSGRAIWGVGALRFMGAAGGAYFIATGGKDTVDSFMDCRYGSAGFGAFITGGRVAYTGMAIAAPATSGASALGAGLTMVGIEGTKIVVNDVLRITDIEGDEASKAIATLMENDFVNPTMHYRLTNIDVLKAVQQAADTDPIYVYLKEKYGEDSLRLIELDIITKSQERAHPRKNTGFHPFSDYTLPASIVDKQFLDMFSTSDVLAQSEGYRQFMLGELKYVNVHDGGVTFQGYRVRDVLRDLGEMDSIWGDESAVENGRDGLLVQTLRDKGFTAADIRLLQNEATRQMSVLNDIVARSDSALDYRFRFGNPEFYNALSSDARAAFSPEDILPMPTDEQVNTYLDRYTSEFAKIEHEHALRYGSCEHTQEGVEPETLIPVRDKRGRLIESRQTTPLADTLEPLASAAPDPALPPAAVVAMLEGATLAGVSMQTLPTQLQAAGTRVSGARFAVADAEDTARLTPSTVSGGAQAEAATHIG